MKALVVIGIIVSLLGFLTGIMVSFPVQETAASPARNVAGIDGNSPEALGKAAEQFSGAYTASYNSVVQSLASYQEHPDLERAEQQREALVAYSKMVVSQFENLNKRFQNMLNQLTQQLDTVAGYTDSVMEKVSGFADSFNGWIRNSGNKR